MEDTQPQHHSREGEEVENSGVKLSWGRGEGWGEGVFEIWFYFSLS